ncbi:GDSL-type esterase/lipase family protein [uncultured Jatrophihabitans sp.]|uniref:GDSL-type esterase/lipase family protein n=1 Tax=uncultured Jatrophihabitans sp. TaxID=1610747 RepID=UPI0035CBF887
MTSVGSTATVRRRPRLRHLVSEGLLILVVAVVSIAVALLVTPSQQVSSAGQTIEVGVTSPSLSVSGPAELDLFGQAIPTTTTFVGPVRPRLRLTHITPSKQLADLTNPASAADSAHGLQQALVSGFHRYFFWQVVIVGAVAVLLIGAVCGWQRRSWRRTLITVVVGLLVAEAIDLGAIMITAYSAPAKLGRVHSLEQLVGGVPSPTPPARRSNAGPGSTVVVLGDSTAAGLGNPALPRPTAADTACRRSVDAYPVDLAQVRSLRVTSLACSGATIAAGILGPQTVGGRTLAPQIADPAVETASTVIVSVGANDVQWSEILRICAVSRNCDNAAEQAYFQSHLAQFSSQWLQLVTDLQQLPNHPRILVNLYYDPFGTDVGCLSKVHITDSKLRSMLSRLATLNSVLGHGADAAGFTTALPDFSGHGVGDDTPYVQGLDGKAPFHPTAAGGLAIALADVHAIGTF